MFPVFKPGGAAGRQFVVKQLHLQDERGTLKGRFTCFHVYFNMLTVLAQLLCERWGVESFLK